jgi:hypothetical protein
VDSRLAQPGWWQAICAAGIALAVDALYLAIIHSEGEGELTSGRVLFVAGCIAGAALALICALFFAPRARAILFTGAAAMLCVWAVLGSFSIGLLLVPAALLAGFAAGHVVADARREAWLAGIGAVLLVAAGLVLT